MLDLQNLSQKVSPIAQKYGVVWVALYTAPLEPHAPGEEEYNFVISKGAVQTMDQVAAFMEELEAALGRGVNIIADTPQPTPYMEQIKQDSIKIYDINGDLN